MGKEKPILFQGAMVRAILDGRKTQTRRVVDRQPDGRGPRWCNRWEDWHGCKLRQPPNEGDVLWVRESVKGIAVESMDGVDGVKYLADGEERWWDCLSDDEEQWFKLCNYGKGAGPNTVPAIHMPRWCSRLSLPVVSVSAERLQEIEEMDARAEGVEVLPLQSNDDPSAWWRYSPDSKHFKSAREAFAALWDSLAKPGSKWNDNPWVWVIEFEVEK